MKPSYKIRLLYSTQPTDALYCGAEVETFYSPEECIQTWIEGYSVTISGYFQYLDPGEDESDSFGLTRDQFEFCDRKTHERYENLLRKHKLEIENTEAKHLAAAISISNYTH